jgi:hypothetical protein
MVIAHRAHPTSHLTCLDRPSLTSPVAAGRHVNSSRSHASPHRCLTYIVTCPPPPMLAEKSPPSHRSYAFHG